jgi:hypothetical protein
MTIIILNIDLNIDKRKDIPRIPRESGDTKESWDTKDMQVIRRGTRRENMAAIPVAIRRLRENILIMTAILREERRESTLAVPAAVTRNLPRDNGNIRPAARIWNGPGLSGREMELEKYIRWRTLPEDTPLLEDTWSKAAATRAADTRVNRENTLEILGAALFRRRNTIAAVTRSPGEDTRKAAITLGGTGNINIRGQGTSAHPIDIFRNGMRT